jgi:hypothetical protein
MKRQEMMFKFWAEITAALHSSRVVSGTRETTLFVAGSWTSIQLVAHLLTLNYKGDHKPDTIHDTQNFIDNELVGSKTTSWSFGLRSLLLCTRRELFPGLERPHYLLRGHGPRSTTKATTSLTPSMIPKISSTMNSLAPKQQAGSRSMMLVSRQPGNAFWAEITAALHSSRVVSGTRETTLSTWSARTWIP